VDLLREANEMTPAYIDLAHQERLVNHVHNLERAADIAIHCHLKGLPPNLMKDHKKTVSCSKLFNLFEKTFNINF